jgi:uncharacterized membrane protein
MPNPSARSQAPSPRFVNLSRLETLGDAIFAFALTLLALDLRLPDVEGLGLPHAMLGLLPRLLIFVFAFLVIAQEWDVHQRTMMHIDHADGTFVWLYLLSLMFVVLMPAAADILGRFPLQPLALVFFGLIAALHCLASWAMWQHACGAHRLVHPELTRSVIRLIARLWLYPALIIAATIPLGFVSVYPVYAVWLLLPILSYSYSGWAFRGRRPTV